MKKRIAIFCDGTWNRAEAPDPTNVVRMAQTVKHSASDGRKQHVIYQMGVGTGRGSSALARLSDKVLGGAMGWGLTENIEDAYRALVFCYEPGDELYIFGFSRGAYTARSLAGLIRYCGIPPRENVGLIPKAMARYRRPKSAKNHPDHESNIEWRSGFAPFTVTSDDEFKWRLANKPGLVEPLTISFLGVWDTVGSLGVPGYWFAAPLLNRDHQFHDKELSSIIGSARHALAIDERRRAFTHTPMERIDELNRRRLGLSEDADLSGIDRDSLPLREEWFPGDHGSVGGGGVRKGLSAYSFDWIAQGAQRAGLEMRPELWEMIRHERDIETPVINKIQADVMTQYMRFTGRDRDGPRDPALVSEAAKSKLAAQPDYRPGTLARVIGALTGTTGRSGGG